MTETRDFHLGDILSVTTGRLVSPRHIDGVCDILNWMTGDNLFTHQLPRASRECEGPLLAQHPDLAAVEAPEDFGGSREAVETWLAEQVAVYGETREVAPLADEDHTRIDPMTELRAKMHPDAEIVVIEVPGEDDCPIAAVLPDGMHDCTLKRGHGADHDFADEPTPS
jgi:hypothetical protein